MIGKTNAVAVGGKEGDHNAMYYMHYLELADTNSEYYGDGRFYVYFISTRYTPYDPWDLPVGEYRHLIEGYEEGETHRFNFINGYKVVSMTVLPKNLYDNSLINKPDNYNGHEALQALIRLENGDVERIWIDPQPGEGIYWDRPGIYNYSVTPLTANPILY